MPRGRTGLLVTISVIALFAAFVGFVTSTVELSFNVLAVLFLGAVLAVLTGFCWLVMAGPGQILMPAPMGFLRRCRHLRNRKT